MKIRNLLFIGLIAAAGYLGAFEGDVVPEAADYSSTSTSTASDRILASAFENQQSNIQVQGGGHVTRILSDDNDGSRHQRFILQLASGQTLLIAHNIDVSRRIASLEVGDYVAFHGEYEWNPQGGVIHWTHHDPQGSHATGWLKHDGKTYQ